AYRLARHVGFDNINIDLMHGLPNQRLGDALQDLEEVIALGPEHISWYQLTIEKNTHFYSSPPSLPDEDALQQIWQRGHELLGSAGYAQYEVSAYARDGRQCEHNLNYWRFGDYLGIGAGAHGKRTLSNGQILRRRKTRMPADYMAGSVADDMTSSQIKAIAEPVPEDEITQEFLMNALRLTDGFDAALYEQRTGQAFSQLEAFIAEGSKRGLLAWQASTGQVQATQLGQRFLDSLLLLAS
ncbi:MAG: coproporphyrinogen-III oxidase family protein, partial [Pseudomonadales bacterium]